MNIAITVVTYAYLYFLGSLIVRRFNDSNNEPRVSNIPIKLFYPLISLFVIGNLTVIFNFFLPLKNLILPLFISTSILVILWMIKIRTELFNLNHFINIVFIPGVLGVASYGIWLGWDTGLYHIPHQLILRDNSIIFGLTNLNIWFGWSSINEYISALLWLNDNFVLLRVLEIMFFCVFMNFVYYLLLSKNNLFFLIGVSLTLFSFLDNFGYLGGGNGFIPMLSVGKYDSTLGILFFLTSFLIFNALKEEVFDNNTYKFILLMSFFSFQMKQTGVYLILIMIPYIYFYIQKNKLKTFSFLKISYVYLSLFLVWIIKNIITTSCLFFPIEFTCIPTLSWHEKVQLDFVDTSMIYSPINFSSGESVISQLETWFYFSKNSQFIINFPISLLVIFVGLKFFVHKNNKVSKNKYTNVITVFLIINLVFWYNSNYANFRYGTGIWLLIVATIAYYYSKYEIRFDKRIQYIVITVFVFSLAQIPRFYSYEAMFSNQLYFESLQIEYNAEYFESSNGWGVYPSTVQCWDVSDCKVEEKDVEPYDYFGTVIFYPDGVSGN